MKLDKGIHEFKFATEWLKYDALKLLTMEEDYSFTGLLPLSRCQQMNSAWRLNQALANCLNQ
jgi:hypothetical protein